MLPVIKQAAKAVGDDGEPNFARLATMIGCQRPSLYAWLSVPPKFLHKIVKATKGQVTLKMLRPDIFKSR